MRILIPSTLKKGSTLNVRRPSQLTVSLRSNHHTVRQHHRRYLSRNGHRHNRSRQSRHPTSLSSSPPMHRRISLTIILHELNEPLRFRNRHPQHPTQHASRNPNTANRNQRSVPLVTKLIIQNIIRQCSHQGS